MKRHLSKELRHFEPILNNNGYYLDRVKGSHYTYTNDINNKSITVNYCASKWLQNKIIKEYNLII